MNKSKQEKFLCGWGGIKRRRKGRGGVGVKNIWKALLESVFVLGKWGRYFEMRKKNPFPESDYLLKKYKKRKRNINFCIKIWWVVFIIIYDADNHPYFCLGVICSHLVVPLNLRIYPFFAGQASSSEIHAVLL